MKFCEKILNLRKQNNMSQEQLADKLGVSRQAVSKWESGSSVPDMEKMMQLCKILNCNLEDLVDDGVGGSKRQTTDIKVTWYTYYKEVIDFITRSFNMFWSMRLFEKVKCLLEMGFLALILFFGWRIIGNLIYSCFFSILTLLPDTINQFFSSVSSSIYQIFGVVIEFVLLIHIFKIRYLDYFITIEDENIKEKRIEAPIEEQEFSEKKEENVRQFIEHKKNKIIIRDPKHSTYSFFGVMAKMVIWFIKFMLVLFAIPCIICFVVISFFAICAFWNLKSGVFFFGLLLAILGLFIINYLILKMIYYFVFELKYSFQKIFIIFIIGLTLLGIGIGISFCNYLTFDKAENIEQQSNKLVEEFDYEEGLVLPFLYYNDNIEIVEDNTISNIKIEVRYHENIKIYFDFNYDYVTDIDGSVNISKMYKIGHIHYQSDDLFEQINYFLDAIKNKKKLEINDGYDSRIMIITSNEILNKLRYNYDKYYN